jgi:hypothetical protein
VTQKGANNNPTTVTVAIPGTTSSSSFTGNGFSSTDFGGLEGGAGASPGSGHTESGGSGGENNNSSGGGSNPGSILGIIGGIVGKSDRHILTAPCH